MKRYLHYDVDKRQTQPWFADEPSYDSDRVVVDLLKGLKWLGEVRRDPTGALVASGAWEPVEGFADQPASVVSVAGFKTERWRGVAYVQHLACGRWGREGWAHSCGGERGNNWHESPWALEKAAAERHESFKKLPPVAEGRAIEPRKKGKKP